MNCVQCHNCFVTYCVVHPKCCPCYQLGEEGFPGQGDDSLRGHVFAPVSLEQVTLFGSDQCYRCTVFVSAQLPCIEKKNLLTTF